MHINVPTFKDPSRVDPISNAYGWICFEAVDANTNSGRIVINVYPDAASAAAKLPPITQISLSLGEIMVAADPDNNVEEKRFPTLDELKANTNFSQAFGTILGILYQALLEHPKFSGAAIVMEG